MHDCSAQLADAELLTAHRENRREDVQRLRVHWRWRAYLGLNGGPEAKALFLAVGQAHVPVPAQIAFHLPDSPVGEPRHVHRLCPGEQGRRHCLGSRLACRHRVRTRLR